MVLRGRRRTRKRRMVNTGSALLVDCGDCCSEACGVIIPCLLLRMFVPSKQKQACRVDDT